ncbi:MAG: alpha/beta hydrolase [Proteobacteria bacterium]|nr:alpha/beta hydrolase [Pseudomonadota bacterium]
MSSEPTPSETPGRPLTFSGKDGLRLHGDAWGEPDAQPVLLLHGGGQTRHAWAGTAARLAEQGFLAIAVDQRGHGDSDWSDAGDYDFMSYGADAVALARSFETPPVLVGASLGGIASLVAATEEPCASALVLVDIATRMESDGVERVIGFMSAQPEGFASVEEAAEAVGRYLPHRPKPSNVEGLRKNLRRHPDGRYRWHWDPRFIESRHPQGLDSEPLDDRARRLRIPTLLVRGRMSDVLSQDGAQHFLELVPHARFADVADAGHMVAGDRNDIFTRAVADFLNDL